MTKPKSKSHTDLDGTVRTAEVEQLKLQLDEATRGWQRTQADFENFRRRTASDAAERTAIDVGRALLTFAPIAENLRRAIGELDRLNGATSTVESLRAWAAGVASIARQFDQALGAAGLTLIDPSPGDPFNPHEHEALTHQPHPDHSVDTVVQVIERGYQAGNRVISPAKVMVSSGPANANAERTMQNEESSVK